MFSLALASASPGLSSAQYGPYAPFARAMEVNQSDSGVTVSALKAMQLSAVYSCCKIVAETLGSLSCYTYQETDSGKVEAEDHPVYNLLAHAPNPYMNTMTWIEAMMWHLLLFAGNSYNVIERETAYGDVTAIWLLRPDRVTPRAENDTIVYDVIDGNGSTKTYAYEDILHVTGESYDGLIGFNPISSHREVFGNAIAQQGFGTAMYRNGVRPTGVFKHPLKMKPEPFKNLQEQLAKYAGSNNTGKVLILEEGMDWQPLGMNLHDADYVAQQKFTMTQIAAIYRVPPKMIGDTEAQSYGSSEADEAYFVKHTLRPWAVRMEREFERKLFRPDERMCVKFDFADLLRGDAVARATANQILRRNGVINANQWAASEDMNRLPGDIGETYVIEGNMTTMDRVGQPTGANLPPAGPSAPPPDDEPPADEGEPDGESVRAAHRRVFVDILDRMSKIEATSRARAEKAGAGACAAAIDAHYKTLVSAIGASADAYAATLASIRRVKYSPDLVHQATRAAAYVAMQGHPAAEACVDEVMRIIAEAVA